MTFQYSEVLRLAESNNGHIDIIQEILIFRCKNGVSDYFIGTNGPNYNQFGYPIDVTNIEVIDISDIVASYNFSNENQFGASVCNLEVANIDGLYSPENITFLEGGARMKSRPVVPVGGGTNARGNAAYVSKYGTEPFIVDSGKDYLSYNPNYYQKGNVKEFNPLFSSNHIIRLREGILVNGVIEWENKFLGLISVPTPSSDGGEPKLSVTCHDFMKLLLQSSCERSYISPIKDLRSLTNSPPGNDQKYYYNQLTNSYRYGKAPSHKLENFNNGFNDEYDMPEDLFGQLVSHGDLRSWSMLDTNTGIINPVFWSTRPQPEIFIGKKTSTSLQDLSAPTGYLVKFYNGLEPKGDPVSILHYSEINFGMSGLDLLTGYIPPNSNIRSATNWCCTIEAEFRYTSDNKSVLFSVVGEGGIQVFWNGVSVDTRDGGRTRDGIWTFAPDHNGFPIPSRAAFDGTDAQTGFIHWSDISGLEKRDKLKVIYRCGESYGTSTDFKQRPGFRNLLKITVADSQAFPDVNRGFPELVGRKVEEQSNEGYDDSYGLESGKWKPKPGRDDLPSFVKANTWNIPAAGGGTTEEIANWHFGVLADGTTAVARPFVDWEIKSDDADWAYNIIYTRGTVEFVKPTSLGDDFGLFARFAFKDITALRPKEIIEDIIIEDVFGIDRWEWDPLANANTYINYPGTSNNPLFNAFAGKILIDDQSTFVDAIKLDNSSTKNAFDAISKVMQGLKLNWKFRADAKGNFVSYQITQSGGPIFGISEDRNENGKVNRLTVQPKTIDLRQRAFISVAALGQNLDQDPGVGSSFLRETFINGEVSVDNPGETSSEDPSYKAPEWSDRHLYVYKFKNMIYDNTSGNFVSANLDGKKKITHFVVYRRAWNGGEWTYRRYEFRVNSPYVKAVTTTGEVPMASISAWDSVLYLRISLGDIFINASTSANSDTGDIRLTTETLPGDINPKTDLNLTTVGEKPTRVMGQTIPGAPLITDYSYITNITTSIQAPIDDSEQYTKVKVIGKKQFQASGDLLTTLKASTDAASVVSNVNMPNFTSSDVLNGLTGDSTLGSGGGVVQGFYNQTLTEYGFIPFKGSFKMVPPTDIDGSIVDEELRFPGIIIGYGKTQPGTGYDPDHRHGASWNRLVEYHKIALDNFFIQSPDPHTAKNEVSGVKSARAFYFRIKVPNPGYAYEFRFEFSQGFFGTEFDSGTADVRIKVGGVDTVTYWRDGNEQLTVGDPYGFIPLPYTTFQGGRQEYEDRMWIRVKTFSDRPYVDVALHYYHNQDACMFAIYYKERKFYSTNASDWDIAGPGKDAWVPMNRIFAGNRPSTFMSLNDVVNPAYDYGGQTGTHHNFVKYTYGRWPVFISDNDSYLLTDQGDTESLGGDGQDKRLYSARLNARTGLFVNDADGYKLEPFLGNWVQATNPSDSADGFEENLFVNIGSSAFSSQFPNTLQTNSGGTYPTPSLASYSQLLTDTGMALFDIDLKTQRDIGEIGVLVGFPPDELSLVDDTEEVKLEMDFTAADNSFFMSLASATELEEQGDDSYISTGYVAAEHNTSYAMTRIDNANTSGQGDCVFNSGGQTTFERAFLKEKPKSIETNSVIHYELAIDARREDEVSWKPLVEWQTVHTRQEFFKFAFDNLINTEYRYLRIKARKPNPIIFSSKVIEKADSKKFVYGIGGQWDNLVAGPEIKLNFTARGSSVIHNLRQLFLSQPARGDIRFIGMKKMYILEKDEVTSTVQAETIRSSEWFNPMLPDNSNRIVKDGLIKNHSMVTVADNSAGSIAKCMNGALLQLNEGIRPKESINLNLAYHPKLEINQTVWVKMGAFAGYTPEIEDGDETGLFRNHPGKLMVIDRISHSKTGTQPQISVSLRNYR